MKTNTIIADREAREIFLEREKIFLENSGLAYSLAVTIVSLFGYTVSRFEWADWEEIIQESRKGLWEAVCQHNPELGKLSTVARYKIRDKIARWLRKSNLIKTNGSRRGIVINHLQENVGSKDTPFTLEEVLPSKNFTPDREVEILDELGLIAEQLKDLGKDLAKVSNKKREFFLTAFGLFGHGPAKTCQDIALKSGLTKACVSFNVVSVFKRRKRHNKPLSSKRELREAIAKLRFYSEIYFSIYGRLPTEFEECLGE